MKQNPEKIPVHKICDGDLNHAVRVCRIAHVLGKGLGLDEDTQLDLEISALLHDYGKQRIPRNILSKRAGLDRDERLIMNLHPELGFAALQKNSVGLDARTKTIAMEVALKHHERLDGKGYPHGLGALSIPLLVRIVSISDVYDALRSARPYRNGLPQAQALEIMAAGEGSQFDPDIMEIFWQNVPLVEMHAVQPQDLPRQESVLAALQATRAERNK